MHWRRQWHPTPVLLPGKPHGWRSLVGFSPCGRKESDTTERLHFHLSLSCIGERNGNPLPCSCLENPRDGRAWWAAVCGVTQSRTCLKWISSSIVCIILYLCSLPQPCLWYLCMLLNLYINCYFHCFTNILLIEEYATIYLLILLWTDTCIISSLGVMNTAVLNYLFKFFLIFLF